MDLSTIMFSIISILISILSAYFWHDRNLIQKRIEKIQQQAVINFQKLQTHLLKIQAKVTQMQQQLTYQKALLNQRPVKQCQTYMAETIQKVKTQIAKEIRYVVIQQLNSHQDVLASLRDVLKK